MNRLLTVLITGFLLFAGCEADPETDPIQTKPAGWREVSMAPASDSGVPESLRVSFAADATCLALRELETDSTEPGNFRIPEKLYNLFYHSLVHCYQASRFPQRDSVFVLEQVHTFQEYLPDELLFAGDTTVAWVLHLIHGEFPTGNPAIDSLITGYQISLKSYRYKLAALRTGTPRANLHALIREFKKQPGVSYCTPNYVTSIGMLTPPDIRSSIQNTELRFCFYPLSDGGSRPYWEYDLNYSGTVTAVRSKK